MAGSKRIHPEVHAFGAAEVHKLRDHDCVMLAGDDRNVPVGYARERDEKRASECQRGVSRVPILGPAPFVAFRRLQPSRHCAPVFRRIPRQQPADPGGAPAPRDNYAA